MADDVVHVSGPRFGALDHLGLAARAVADPGTAGVWLGERRFRAKLNLRGDPTNQAFMDAAGAVLDGFHPRIIANTAVHTDAFDLLWLGPDEWMIVSKPGTEATLAKRLAVAVAPHGGTVTDVTDSRTTITVSGAHARDVLAKGCPIDLHPRKFNPGDCAQSLVARVGVILMRVDDGTTPVPSFELHVLRSMADYLWRFLEDAGLEYGVAVLEEKN
jgi:sarcosine oxidase, subunit gamma